MKLISFAVPCYNSAEYMDKCIESLLKAGENAEIIIVNDGSTKDNTKEIADAYAEKYPNIIKAIHKENGGHGDAVNFGLKNAVGKYFKVVDSDDWVDEDALNKIMETIKAFNDKSEFPDAILSNYVYEHVYNNTQKIVDYKKQFPEEKVFDFEESKPFEKGKFIAMHSLIYRTELLKEINLELPKHTFYVDNLFIYYPLPFVKTFYYINVNFYRYFIGRPDQSVAEKVIMKRIDQHIRVTEILIASHNISEFKESRPMLYKFMRSFMQIMMTINSIYLIKLGGKENYKRKSELWEYFKEKAPNEYKYCKKDIQGLVSVNSRFVGFICKIIYWFARKIFKFN